MLTKMTGTRIPPGSERAGMQQHVLDLFCTLLTPRLLLCADLQVNFSLSVWHRNKLLQRLLELLNLHQELLPQEW